MRSGILHDPTLRIAMKAASTNWKKSLKPSGAATTLPYLFVGVMSPQSVFTDRRRGILRRRISLRRCSRSPQKMGCMHRRNPGEDNQPLDQAQIDRLRCVFVHPTFSCASRPRCLWGCNSHSPKNHDTHFIRYNFTAPTSSALRQIL